MVMSLLECFSPAFTVYIPCWQQITAKQDRRSTDCAINVDESRSTKHATRVVVNLRAPVSEPRVATYLNGFK